MKTRGKVLLLIVSAMALVIASIFGTLAYLTDTEAVTNTFTVGHVDITLDEADVNDAGQPLDKDGNIVDDVANAARVDKNKYHLVPGHVYVKDPTVTVKAGSEQAYVRMKVTVDKYSGLTSAIPAEKNPLYYGTDKNNRSVFLIQNLCTGWDETVWEFAGFELDTDDNSATYEFRYKGIVGEWHGSTSDKPLAPLFKTISLPGDLIGNDEMDDIEGVKITVVAHAIQADGFENANAAWDAWQDNGSFTIETE